MCTFVLISPHIQLSCTVRMAVSPPPSPLLSRGGDRIRSIPTPPGRGGDNQRGVMAARFAHSPAEAAKVQLVQFGILSPDEIVMPRLPPAGLLCSVSLTN